MAEPKQIPRRQVQNPIIATYDYQDIASGTGIVNFYPLAEKNSSGTVYHMIPQQYNSAVVELDGSGTYTFTSLAFNLPRYVKGTAYFSGNFYDAGAGADNVAVKIQHWDGTTATDLTATHTSENGTTTSNNIVFLVMPITTEKQITKGEYLRLVVTWTDSAGDSKLGISPTNQTAPGGNLNPTQMIVGIPFRIEN